MDRASIPVNADKTWYLNRIQYGLDFVRNTIQPYFNANTASNHGNQRPKEVSKTKLNELWTHNKRKAIEIIKQDGMDFPRSFCPASKDAITDVHANKNQRTVGSLNPEQAPWMDLNLFPQPGQNSNRIMQRITEQEVTENCSEEKCARSRLINLYVDYKLGNVMNVVKILTSIFNTCLSNCKIPSDWNQIGYYI